MFNPDLLKNFNPQYLKNINPEMMKTASEKISSMSDEQIKRTMSMAGMNNIDPQMLKKSSEYMKGMKNQDLQRMKDVMYQQSSKNKKTPQDASNGSIKFKKILDLKNVGNQFFKKSNYQKASDIYLQALNQIEQQTIKVQLKYKDQLKALENTIRLNYAISQSKLGNFMLVKRQTTKILQHSPNPKASFRLAQALYQLGQPKDALKHVQIALKGLGNDQTIKKLKFKIEQKLKQMKKNKNSGGKQQGKKKQQQKNEKVQQIKIQEIKKEDMKYEDKIKVQQKKQRIIKQQKVQEQEHRDVIIEQQREDRNKKQRNDYKDEKKSTVQDIDETQYTSKKSRNNESKSQGMNGKSQTMNGSQIDWGTAFSLKYMKQYYKHNFPLVILVLSILLLQYMFF